LARPAEAVATVVPAERQRRALPEMAEAAEQPARVATPPSEQLASSANSGALAAWAVRVDLAVPQVPARQATAVAAEPAASAVTAVRRTWPGTPVASAAQRVWAVPEAPVAMRPASTATAAMAAAPATAAPVVRASPGRLATRVPQAAGVARPPRLPVLLAQQVLAPARRALRAPLVPTAMVARVVGAEPASMVPMRHSASLRLPAPRAVRAVLAVTQRAARPVPVVPVVLVAPVVMDCRGKARARALARPRVVAARVVPVVPPPRVVVV
jgi:hypothetical protein